MQEMRPTSGEVGVEIHLREDKILSSLQQHHEGLSIVDIGNALGVDWRSLTEEIQALLQERKIEKIGTMYSLRESGEEGE